MKLLSDSVDKTYSIARLVASHLKGGETILLNGQLGAGKTTFTKGLAKALGITKTVVSPTFTIAREYEGKFKLYHIDMYRIEDLSEIDELGLDEFFSPSSIVVIEWNKLKNLENVININIETVNETSRIFSIEGLVQ